MFFDPYAYDLAASAGRPTLPGAGAALAADVLLDVPQEAQDALWQGLTEAVEGALDVWERTPAGGRRTPPPFNVQHAGKPQFNPADLRRQTLKGWHRLMGIELRLAAQALEALIQADGAVYWALLAEECGRVGQLYSELARRAGAWVALALMRWELRLLRYRASPVMAGLVYD